VALFFHTGYDGRPDLAGLLVLRHSWNPPNYQNHLICALGAFFAFALAPFYLYLVRRLTISPRGQGNPVATLKFALE